jgi:hypothetical protein
MYEDWVSPVYYCAHVTETIFERLVRTPLLVAII